MVAGGYKLPFWVRVVMFCSVFLSSQYFETDDPEFYKSKVCFILNNDMSEMELVFAEEKYNKSGQLDKVRKRTKARGSHGSQPLEQGCQMEISAMMEMFFICAVFRRPNMWLVIQQITELFTLFCSH